MTTKSEGILDPGAPPRRKSMSGCKCLVFSAVTVILLGIGLAFLSFVTNLASLFTPHRALYHNATLERIANRASVVQPLVGREQTFDLAATVWLRTSIQGKHRDFEYPVKEEIKVENVEERSEEEAKEGQPGDNVLVEKALYSDIIFRGVRLTDKNLRTTVNFTVPTALFRNANLTNYDIRGSVMLIPTSPSPLDHVTNYSSYVPDSVEMLSVRTWPFPLGSQDHRNKSLAEQALESFGVSIPLVQFHGVKSRCVESANDASKGSTKPDGIVDDDDEKEEDDSDEDEKPTSSPSKPFNVSALSSLQVTDGKPALKTHPYIVTRTQIRVLDETKLFNRKAYNKAHKTLKKTSCGQGVLVRPNRYFCKRPYLSNGNWETQLQLRVLNESTGKVRTEWAYAPFIHVSLYAYGQKDLLAIPVNRENCSQSAKVPSSLSSDAPEKESIDVSWKISYTGRTPAKMIVADYPERPRWYAFNETENAEVFEHDSAELANGLVGHRFSEDGHPRRRSLIMLLSNVLPLAIACLEIRYWFTRRSTVGISIPGTALTAASWIIAGLDDAAIPLRADNSNFFAWIVALLTATFTVLVDPLIQLKAIFRIEVTWWKGWIPVLQKAKATHSERASERMEARTSWSTKTGLFLSVVALYYFLAPHNYAVIAAVTIKPKATDLSIEGFFPGYLFWPMYMVGNIFQIILNGRSGLYAGRYRISAALIMACHVLKLADFVPALVGRFDTRDALYAQDVVEIGLMLVMTWQAFVLPSVPQIVEEDHIE
ncbi:hypothetical protein D9615_010329 [Tricholomella constricta]|uniref:Uncharacterized protein n=1 Tax=Tricholomella constricta TaxID=117010 RepID=A0A8H5GSN3_9AGAR|nr:hypothetical protein D9615_010329 [Tricholomella constricta]